MDHKGIGGGATARVRAAYALAGCGHRLLLYINCPRERTELGVETRHFSKLKEDHSDIFIASTSGGQFNLADLERIPLDNHLKILFVHGVAQPNGLSAFHYDYIYPPSNFIREKVVHEWRISPEKVFVSYRGVVRITFCRPRLARTETRSVRPSLFRASFQRAGHRHRYSPILAQNRQSLHFTCLCRCRLVGKGGENPLPEPGIAYHGIIGQSQLAREIQLCGFSINLQDRQEPFGMTLIEAMRAGCISLASPVGAYPEIITHGQNGFLVPGDHTQEPARQAAVDIILALTRNPDYVDYLRRNAIHTPLTWDTVARTWEGHWNWFFTGKQPPGTAGLGACNECQGAWLPLADGLHCINCGNYQRKSSSTQ